MGGLSYKMSAALIVMFSFKGDVFQIIAIGAAIGASVVLVNIRTYDNLDTTLPTWRDVELA